MRHRHIDRDGGGLLNDVCARGAQRDNAHPCRAETGEAGETIGKRAACAAGRPDYPLKKPDRLVPKLAMPETNDAVARSSALAFNQPEMVLPTLATPDPSAPVLR